MTTLPDDDSGVRQAIDYYIDGVREGNVSTLKNGFHSQAVMCGYPNETVMAVPIQGLYDWVEANPAPAATGERFTCTVIWIEITGRAAAARVEELWPTGTFVDYFSLLKVEDRWWIVSKTFDAK